MHFKNLLTEQERKDFSYRQIIFQNKNHKFRIHDDTVKQGAKYKKYFVEISLLKNKMVILLVDVKNKTRMFQLDQSASADQSQLDGGTNTILLLQLWKK